MLRLLFHTEFPHIKAKLDPCVRGLFLWPPAFGALRHLQLTFLGNPFVILIRMLYPILELAVVALWQPPCNRIDPAGSVHSA